MGAAAVARPSAKPAAPLYNLPKPMPNPEPIGDPHDLVTDMGYMFLGAVMGIVGTLIYY